MTDNELLLAISDILEKKLDTKIQPLTTEIQSFREDMAIGFQSIRDDMKRMRNDIQDLKTYVSQIELHLENTTDANVKLFAENYMPAVKKYEIEAAKIESMQTDIAIMRSVLIEHSEKLQKIS